MPVLLKTYKIKTLSGDKFEIPCDESGTVLDLKEKIAQLKNTIVTDKMKLIFFGNILKNDAKLIDIEYTDDKQMVVMLPPKTLVKNSDSLKNNKVEEKEDNKLELSSINTDPNVQPLQQLNTNTNTDIQIQQPLDADSNVQTQQPDAAIMPLIMLQLMRIVQQPDMFKQLLQNTSFMDRLINTSEFRQILLNHPEFRFEILRSDPRLNQFITQNENEFRRIVTANDFLENGFQMMENIENTLGMDTQQYSDGPTADQVQIDITDEDKNNIEEIMMMLESVSQDEVIQTYVACGKNKEMTINTLLG